jgi:hypothetical protein
MQWTQRVKGFQDHHVQGALQNFRSVSGHDRSFGHCKEDITLHLERPKENQLGVRGGISAAE